jgi:hypothetical protein
MLGLRAPHQPPAWYTVRAPHYLRCPTGPGWARSGTGRVRHRPGPAPAHRPGWARLGPAGTGWARDPHPHTDSRVKFLGAPAQSSRAGGRFHARSITTRRGPSRRRHDARQQHKQPPYSQQPASQARGGGAAYAAAAAQQQLSVASPWWVSNKSHKGSSCRRNAKLICNGHGVCGTYVPHHCSPIVVWNHSNDCVLYIHM